MNNQDKIAVIQAQENGEVIERRRKDGSAWTECVHPQFNFADCEYRVKSETLVVNTVYVHTNREYIYLEQDGKGALVSLSNGPSTKAGWFPIGQVKSIKGTCPNEFVVKGCITKVNR